MFKNRWQALGAAFLLMVLSLPLGGGCTSDDPAVKIYTPDESGVSECRADHPDQATQCEQALSGSEAEHANTAPHLSLDDCIAQYGHDSCLPRDNGSYYAPAMAGFMFGVGVGVGVVPYHPVYVNSWGQAYYGTTVLGTYRPGVHVYITPAPGAVWVNQYHYKTVSIPHNTPTAAPAFSRSPSGAPVIQRGGTGASAGVVAAPRPPPSAGPPPGAIQRGNTGNAAAVSGAVPPKPPEHAGPPPGSHIERGNTGGAAATTKAAAPPAPPTPHYDRPSSSSSSSGISRGGMSSGGASSRSSSSGKR